MPIHVKDGATWKESSKVWVKDSDTWKEAQSVWVKDSGLWKESYSSGVPPVLWNKLGSDAEVENSEIGVDFTKTGGAYAACKFDNGFSVTGNSQYLNSDADVIDINVGCIEFWYKPNFASTATATCTHVSSTSVVSQYIQCVWYNGLFRFLFVGGTGSTLADAAAVFSAGDLIHVGYVWDKDGIDGSADKIRVYVYNQNTGLSYSAAGNYVAHASTIKTIRIGNRGQNDGNANGVIDNIKVWDYAKIDFSDKDIEGV